METWVEIRKNTSRKNKNWHSFLNNFLPSPKKQTSLTHEAFGVEKNSEDLRESVTDVSVSHFFDQKEFKKLKSEIKIAHWRERDCKKSIEKLRASFEQLQNEIIIYSF